VGRGAPLSRRVGSPLSRCAAYTTSDFEITVVFVDIVDLNVTCTDRFRHGLPINMPNLDCVSLREEIQQNPDSRLGFVVYRLTYTNDAQWERFMDHLNTRIRLNFEDDGEGDMFQFIDWDVQEDPALQDAGDDDIRM
jgi:hypothetical protein